MYMCINLFQIIFLAIRSGDYYMFDELDDELDLLPEETRDEDEKSDMPTIGEVSSLFCLLFMFGMMVLNIYFFP